MAIDSMYDTDVIATRAFVWLGYDIDVIVKREPNRITLLDYDIDVIVSRFAYLHVRAS